MIVKAWEFNIALNQAHSTIIVFKSIETILLIANLPDTTRASFGPQVTNPHVILLLVFNLA